MKEQTHRIVMGTALGLASIAILIDHTRHRLPEPIQQNSASESDTTINPCSLGGSSPCSLGNTAPCRLGKKKSPCSL